MVEKILYPSDEVNRKPIPYFKLKYNIVAIMKSSKDGRARFVGVNAALAKGGSFSIREEELRSEIPGGGVYCEIEPTPESEDIIRKLELSKTVVLVDDEGYCTITHKDYYIMYPVKGMSDGFQKQVESLHLSNTPVWTVDEGDNVAIYYSEPASTTVVSNVRAGYLLTARDIQKIYDARLNELLFSDDTFAVYTQTGNVIKQVPFDDKVMKRYPGKVSVKPSKVSERISSYFEFDPYDRETIPSFGEMVEIEPVSSLGSETVWKITPKILQHDHPEEFAERVLELGHRVAVTIPDEEARKEIEEKGLSDHVIEFTKAPGMGNMYYIEKGANLTKSAHIKK